MGKDWISASEFSPSSWLTPGRTPMWLWGVALIQSPTRFAAHWGVWLAGPGAHPDVVVGRGAHPEPHTVRGALGGVAGWPRGAPRCGCGAWRSSRAPHGSRRTGGCGWLAPGRTPMWLWGVALIQSPTRFAAHWGVWLAGPVAPGGVEWLYTQVVGAWRGASW